MVTSSIPDRRGGLLVEVMISVLLVGLVIAPAVGVFTTVAANYNRQAEMNQAHLLSRSLLTEIVQADFEDSDDSIRVFGLESDESTANRADFDDIDDYSGLSESTILSKDGKAIPDAEGFTRSTEVRYVRIQSSQVSNELSPTRLKRIGVTVQTPSGYKVTDHALRSASGFAESVAANGMNELQSVEVQLKLGLRTDSTKVEVLNKFSMEESQ